MHLKSTFRADPIWVLLKLLAVLLFGYAAANAAYCAEPESEESGDLANLVSKPVYRGPVHLLVTASESRAVTVNELSGTVSLLDLETGAILDEKAVGERPGHIAWCGNRRDSDEALNELLVSCRYSGEVVRFRIEGDELVETAKITVGFEPLGLAANQHVAYVGLQATGEVAEIDLSSNEVRRRISVGKWPRYLALSQDGSRIAVGLSGQSGIAVVDTQSGEILYEEPLSGGINIGHLDISNDGRYVYFPWMIYRTNPITVRDIQRGWVLASRVARIRMDGPEYRQAISLDVPRLAVADPFGIVRTPDEHRMAVTSSGTHELLVYRLPDLPFIGAGGPGDLIDRKLLEDSDLFYRIELGGRPMGMVASRDNRRVFVANQMDDCVQVVDLESRKVLQTFALGPKPEDLVSKKVHQGMEIFYDAERSLDQWYSCHSCHIDGGTNAKAMDTWNDGTELTAKTVLPLTNVTETSPWTWHGWQEDLDASLQNSFVSTMKGKKASDEDIAALRSYLASLTLPPNPFTDGASHRDAASRGKKLFESERVGCSDCHSGPKFTDGAIHDVGMSRETDAYEGYNTPSLKGLYRKVRYLHDGRSKSLESVLTKWHRPDEIGGGAELTEQELSDLIAYLMTL